MKTVILLIIAYLLCSCTPAVTMPSVVKIPVPVQCPEPPPITRPHLPIASLPTTPTPDQYVRAIESSLEILIGYAERLETLLNGYKQEKR